MKDDLKQPAMESRRCRAPSNEFSHDFLAKMRKDDTSPQPDLSPNPHNKINEAMGAFLSLAEEEQHPRGPNDFHYD